MFLRLLTYVLASVVTSQAVNVCAWTNNIACSGSSFCCNSLGANNCCMNVPAGFGVSISYDGLPGPISAGQAWTSGNCVAGAIDVAQAGTGNKCFVGGGGVKAGSMAWTHAPSKREATPIEYATPDTFNFEVDGVAKAIKIPATNGAVELVAELFWAGNFTALLAFESAD
ncbi:hypothetical protein MVEN_01282200 [Mycena venus]|uniref:Uncharacterized protein n=1 Tax=Mycena venus TaxID=2733690 RepID=A0A8H6Y122_9AGAR|nr:hypothetical protein MVEN_01282200 [Mycena venus]